MLDFRLTATLGAACAATAVLAGCTLSPPVTSTAPASGTPASGTAALVPAASATARPSASAPASPASAPPVALPAAPPSVAASSAPGTAASGCARRTGVRPNSSITVCPDAAPVGGIVHVTIKGCALVNPPAGLPDVAAAALFFLGRDSWLGTNGGGGAYVPFSPQSGSGEATATFTVPATYKGGNEKAGPYPTLPVAPGTRYSFVTDPAGECNAPFTVTAG
jgi:hypothetical protein